MAHFAQLDENNVVLAVIVVSNETVNNLPFPESEPIGIAFCQSLYGENTVWKQTSYNRSFRVNYAGIGSIYVPQADVFAPSQPYPSWTLNVATGEWEAPIPSPTFPEGYTAVWDELAQEWDIILIRGGQ
jgi:hypothetical protein